MFIHEQLEALELILSEKQMNVLKQIYILNQTRGHGNTTHKQLIKATAYNTSYLSGALYLLEIRHKVIISVTLNSHLYATGIYNTYRINSKGIAVLKKDLALVQQTVNSSEYEKLLRTTVNTLQGQSDRPSLSV
jgi:hypothetical protein